MTSTPPELPRQAHDLTGKRYGKLLVVSFSHSDQGCWWNVRCDCGSEKAVYAANLKRDGTKSCGCSHVDNARRRVMEEGDQSLRKRVLAGYRNNARQRKVDWNLSEETFYRLITQTCTYCGAPPSNVAHNGKNKERTFLYSGIDRSDNQRGYEENNVVPCCAACNLAKRGMTTEEFIAWAHRVSAHNR